jgi:DNA invertase Pin-like site-specific DNA recombinase
MFIAVNAMMLDVLAAVARKDYEDRRRRQAQGQARAKAEGRYKGRQENVDRNKGICRDAARAERHGRPSRRHSDAAEPPSPRSPKLRESEEQL